MPLDPISTVLAAALFAPLVPTSARYSDRIQQPPALEPLSTDRLVLNTKADTEINLYTPGRATSMVDLRDMIYAQLDRYEAYGEAWDGPGSFGPSTESLHAARQFLKGLTGGLPLPLPMLSSSGEVGFYWDEERGYADLSFDRRGVGSFFLRTAQGQETYVEDVAPDALTRKWLFENLGEICAPLALAA